MFDVTTLVTASLRTSLHTRSNLISQGLHLEGTHSTREAGDLQSPFSATGLQVGRALGMTHPAWRSRPGQQANWCHLHSTGQNPGPERANSSLEMGQPTRALDHQAQPPPNGAGGPTAGRAHGKEGVWERLRD